MTTIDDSYREAPAMYSVVLTAMMSTGAAAPDFGGWFSSGGHGCQGCVGCLGCGGCYGSGFGCGGCVGCCGGCSGCGGGFLGLGLLSASRRSCFGCSGCFGCGGCCGGCFGSCFGCAGSCFGCIGAPIIVSSGYGLDPVGFGMPGPTMPMIPGPSMGPGGTPVAPPAPGAALGETLTPANPPSAAPPTDAASVNQATVVVTLPADARLYADGQLMDQAGPVRTFRTPPLEPGKSYYYMLSIEVTRDGRTQRSEERVQLEAGKVARVSFTEPAPAAGNTAQLRIRVPEGASLVVEGQPVDTPGGVAVIRTPALTTGQTHVYELKVEFTRQGQKHAMSREVSFRAGQEVRLVFDEPTSRLTGR